MRSPRAAAAIAGNEFAAVGLGRDKRQYTVHQQIFANDIPFMTPIYGQGLRPGNGSPPGTYSAIVGRFTAGHKVEQASLIVIAGIRTEFERDQLSGHRQD